jgi:hypothetical protein
MLSQNEIILKLQIEELLSRYCRIVDCKDYEKFPEIFARNIKIDVIIQGLSFRGSDSFREFLEKTKPYSSDRMHLTSNLSVKRQRKRIDAIAYWHSTMTYKDLPIVEGGWYEISCDLRTSKSLKFDIFKIYHKYRTIANVKSWREVGFPGTEIKMSKDSDIFQALTDWF